MSEAPAENVWSVQAPPPSSTASPADDNQGIIVGIDLGTSNSVAAVWHPGFNRAEVVYRTASTLTFEDAWDSPKVGLSAPACAPAATASSSSSHILGAKMVMGLTSAQVRDSLPIGAVEERLPPNLDLSAAAPAFLCHLGSGDSGGVSRVSPEEACTHLLRAIRTNAENHLFRTNPLFRAATASTSAGSACYLRENNLTRSGSDSGYSLYRAVIGIPASFAEAQRQAIRVAAAAAGFADTHLLVESTAAAVAYGLGVAGSKVVMTVDVGGGTTDVTVMRVTQTQARAATALEDAVSEAKSEFQVLCTAGARAGGRDVDALLLQYAEQSLQYTGTVSASASASDHHHKYRYVALQRAREAKERLSLHDTATISLAPSGQGTVAAAVTVTITAPQLAAAAEPVLQQVCQVVTECLQNYRAASRGGGTDVVAATVDEVVLVGGSTRMPCLRKALIDTLGAARAITIRDDAVTTTFEMCTSIDADEAVAEGLAIRGAILMGVDRGQLQDLLMMDALPNALGVLVPRGDLGAGGLGDGDVPVLASQVRGATSAALFPQSDGDGDALAFLQVLPAGHRIPGSATRHFAMHASACRHQKVSLCVVERNCCFYAATIPTATATAALTSSDIYDVVGTFDFAVPAPVPARAGQGEEDTGALVKFSVSEAGELGFAVVQQQQQQHGESASYSDVDISAVQTSGAAVGEKVEEGGVSWREVMLVMHVVALFVAFLWLKAAGLGPPSAAEAGEYGANTVTLPQELC